MPALTKVELSDEALVGIGRERMAELLAHLAAGDREGYIRQLVARYEAGQTSTEHLLGRGRGRLRLQRPGLLSGEQLVAGGHGRGSQSLLAVATAP